MVDIEKGDSKKNACTKKKLCEEKTTAIYRVKLTYSLARSTR